MDMARKEDKLRPYRVDYFNVAEMKDVDQALVLSTVVRAVTAAEAAGRVLTDNDSPPIFLIRSHRFYQQLGPRVKDVYVPVEDLFTAKQAIDVMEQVEFWRKEQVKTNDLGNTPAAQVQQDAVAAQADAYVEETPALVAGPDVTLTPSPLVTAVTNAADQLGADGVAYGDPGQAGVEGMPCGDRGQET